MSMTLLDVYYAVLYVYDTVLDVYDTVLDVYGAMCLYATYYVTINSCSPHKMNKVILGNT